MYRRHSLKYWYRLHNGIGCNVAVSGRISHTHSVTVLVTGGVNFFLKAGRISHRLIDSHRYHHYVSAHMGHNFDHIGLYRSQRTDATITYRPIPLHIIIDMYVIFLHTTISVVSKVLNIIPAMVRLLSLVRYVPVPFHICRY